jgi:hypothetical protein
MYNKRPFILSESRRLQYLYCMERCREQTLSAAAAIRCTYVMCILNDQDKLFLSLLLPNLIAFVKLHGFAQQKRFLEIIFEPLCPPLPMLLAIDKTLRFLIQACLLPFDSNYFALPDNTTNNTLAALAQLPA